MAVAGRQRFLGLEEEEELFVKQTAARLAVSGLTHPLGLIKTLQQLGHEPFPLSTGKTLIVAGRHAYFLPNSFSYGSQLVSSAHSYTVLFTGFESAAIGLIVARYADKCVSKFIDKNYTEIGGKAEFEGMDERDLSDYQSFRRMIRTGIRDSFVRTCGVIAARPFIVVSIRQIAQLIGGETKYLNGISALRLIGVEEGPPGLFSGLVPQLIGELILIWGIHSLTFAAERALVRAQLDNNEDRERGEKDLKEARKMARFLIPHIVSPFSYPYSVVSTVMAVAGSGLLVSMLPFSPAFSHWHDAYEYLRPQGGLKRGSRMFLREQVGAVSVGTDRQLYASNKHFA